MSFSKIGWVLSFIVTLVITVLAVVSNFQSLDTSIYNTLLSLSYGELSVYSGFLLKKSEKENTKGGIVYETALKDSTDDSFIE